MAEDLSTVVANSLRKLLQETLIRADTKWAYVLNRGEPGFVDTLKSLSAETVSKPPRPGRKPIVSHANHVLFGWELAARAVDGDRQAFDDADWDVAWKLERVNAGEWSALLGRLQATAEHILEAAPKVPEWNEMMLTGTFAIAAHTAYHMGAVRQMLRDLQPAK